MTSEEAISIAVEYGRLTVQAPLRLGELLFVNHWNRAAMAESAIPIPDDHRDHWVVTIELIDPTSDLCDIPAFSVSIDDQNKKPTRNNPYW